MLLLLTCLAAPVFAQHEGYVMPQASPSQDEAATDKMHEQEMDHSQMDHSRMDHGQHAKPSFDHSTMDHAVHDQTAPPSPTLPPPTAEERAAAFPDLHGMDMRDHMDDDPLIGMLQFDQLEWQDNGDSAGLGWNLRGWLGYVDNRLWLRGEGERRDGHTEHGDVELLWGHATGPWWDVLVGVRHDFGAGVPRDWLAVGVQGLAPYKFEVAATAYVGESGRLAARAEAEYELLLTNRLILQPKLEANLYSRDDPENGRGQGLSDAGFGLRLRYEIHRQFAPYVGYTWTRRFGAAADMAEAAGGERSEGQWVAGFRFWF